MRATIRVFFAAACLLPTALNAAAPPPVQVGAGVLQGDTTDGVDSWKGIPFAAPPVGPLRWRAPQPEARWAGVRRTVAYGHDCMQVPFPSDAAPLGTPPAEDCLYLNVWRPSGASMPLPVVVWIYGGGFVNGGASPPTYTGAGLAKQGVMMVSFNYRLGRFGTFAHPALTKTDADHGLRGNYGHLDQIMALRWVRRNIAAFGGDPSNVTIMGESAGGMSVLTLLTSPLAKGLFAKAVIMSGGDGEPLEPGALAGAEKIGEDFARSMGIDGSDDVALRRLRALSADAVTSGLNMTALFNDERPRSFASPFVDGRIAVDVNAALKTGAYAHVPVLIGATSGDIGGDTGFMIAGARRLAKLLSTGREAVYEYRFSYVATSLRSPANTKAIHASDIPFFLDTQRIKYGPETSPPDDATGQAISGYIVRFAQTGDPNDAKHPAWPRYDAAHDQLIDFASGGSVIAESDPLGAAIDAAPTTSSKAVMPKLPTGH